MSNKIYIIDFEDSFTLNIFSIISPLYPQVEIASFSKLEEIACMVKKQKGSLFAIVLGPGPGHPDKHSCLFPAIKSLLSVKNVFVLGICLGHQIMARTFGLEVIKSECAVHGEVCDYELEVNTHYLPKKFSAQRYNSLCVTKSSEYKLDSSNITYAYKDQEIFLMSGPRFISYQFHPESIGTYYRKIFFKSMLRFLL